MYWPEATLSQAIIIQDIFLQCSLRVFAGPQFDFRFYTHFSCDGPRKIFQGTTARPLYGDYGTDLDLRAGVGYVGAATTSEHRSATA